MFYHERWPVFHEDNHLLVLYKPAGLIMQRDYKNKANLLDLVKSWIKECYGKPGNVFAGMVHRLDGPVAGVVVVARTSKAASRLSDQFRRGGVEKQYLAVVEGRPPKPADRLENLVSRAGRLSRIAAPETPGAQRAVLNYHLQDDHADRSWLEINLETGRRHQIRLQLSHIGCPIVGDVNYGASAGMAHGRIALLAHRLLFEHPTQGIRLRFESPLPRGWPMPGAVEGPDEAGDKRPFWTIEEYEQEGLVLPVAAGR